MIFIMQYCTFEFGVDNSEGSKLVHWYALLINMVMFRDITLLMADIAKWIVLWICNNLQPWTTLMWELNDEFQYLSLIAGKNWLFYWNFNIVPAFNKKIKCFTC